MQDAKEWVARLLRDRKITVPPNRKVLFEQFVSRPESTDLIQQAIQNEERLMARWKVEDRIAEIVEQPARILNATIGKPYETKFDFDAWGWRDIVAYKFTGLEEVGLRFDQATEQITGTPSASGDFKIGFRFKLQGQSEEEDFAQKTIPLIINPDPRSLWKNLPNNRDDPYWKEDNVTQFASIGDRHLLVSCKRGRAHANVGSYREDDYAFGDLKNGWSIVVVGDGAGSAKISRKGSAIACGGIVDYFKEKEAVENLIHFDELVQQYRSGSGEDTDKKITHFVYNNLGKAAFAIHKKLEAFGKAEGFTLKDLSTTLIYTLFKKYDGGYAMLSFGVGDCPMGVLNKDITEVTLLNWIDVGEFGGGTRFITMPEIFSSDKFATRFSFKWFEDFSYLIMMSDGIYDPKFVTESALPDINKWKEFLADLDGKNEDKARVELKADNPQIEEQLSTWMDFWSIGNHDDRTLAIVF